MAAKRNGECFVSDYVGTKLLSKWSRNTDSQITLRIRQGQDLWLPPGDVFVLRLGTAAINQLVWEHLIGLWKKHFGSSNAVCRDFKWEKCLLVEAGNDRHKLDWPTVSFIFSESRWPSPTASVRKQFAIRRQIHAVIYFTKTIQLTSLIIFKL